MLSSSVENLSARRYNSSVVVSGSKDNDWKNGVEVFQYCIHTVNINMIDRLSEPAREIPNGLIFPFKDGLDGADVPLLSD